MNRPRHGVNGRAKKTDISQLVALHVDIDPPKQAGTDLAAAQQVIRAKLEQASPTPSVIIASGGGYQGFWLLDQPVDVTGAEDIERLEAYNIALEQQLGADHCHNLDRIMRVPGTTNLPDAKKRALGRTAVAAELVRLDLDCRYRLENFEPAAKPNGGNRNGNGNGAASTYDPGAWLSELIRLGHDPEQPARWQGDRSKAVFAVACGLVKTGWRDDQIAAVLIDPNNGISAHVLEQADPAQYAQRQAVQARKAAPSSDLGTSRRSYRWQGRDFVLEVDGVARDTRGAALRKTPTGYTIEEPPASSPTTDDGSECPWIHETDPPAYLDWAELDGTPILPQPWLVPGWSPRLETTGLGGVGGEGKSTLVQMLGTAGAIKEPWLKIELPVFRSFLVLCEDRKDDIRRRQEKINRAYGSREWNLIDNLRIWPRRGNEHNYLMVFDRDGVGHRTSFYEQLVQEIRAFRLDLIVLDTKADLFFGDQNDEQQARTFVRQCTDRLAEACGGAVILIYHPSRTGMRDGSGQSGSAQWDAAFRCRLVLTTPEPADKDEPVDEDARVLTRAKANFARRNETIEIKWVDGIFVRTDQPAPTGVVAQAKAQKADRVFRQLFDENQQLNGNQPLSNSSTTGRYAPKVFAKNAHSEKVTLKEFEGAMHRALTPEGGFKIEEYGPPSDRKYRIAKAL